MLNAGVEAVSSAPPISDPNVTGDAWDMLSEYFTTVTAERTNFQFSDLVEFAPTVIQHLSPDGAIDLITEAVGPQHKWLLEKYDAEFCVLPITSDTKINPFRFRKQKWQSSPLLLHAILALCCQHLTHERGGMWSEQAAQHIQEATRLLESAASRGKENGYHDLYLLDPILVMFTLDCTLSAYGRWTQHLERACRLLEDSGGPAALITPQLRSQVGMLIWWDVTLALVSRRGLTIDPKYFDHIHSMQQHDQWTFYELAGCPSGLMVYLVQLAELAKQAEIAASMTWLSFDMTPVHLIEQAVKDWQDVVPEAVGLRCTHNGSEYPSASGTADFEERHNAQQDRSEAWRYAIQIYNQRVFYWDRKQTAPAILKVLTRKALDHVRSCRRTSQTQKQILLPVFLAGAEVNDEEMRQTVTDYGTWWAERCRYKMFSSASELLQDVWASSRETDPTRWWGSVVDQESGACSGSTEYQYLFG